MAEMGCATETVCVRRGKVVRAESGHGDDSFADGVHGGKQMSPRALAGLGCMVVSVTCFTNSKKIKVEVESQTKGRYSGCYLLGKIKSRCVRAEINCTGNVCRKARPNRTDSRRVLLQGGQQGFEMGFDRRGERQRAPECPAAKAACDSRSLLDRLAYHPIISRLESGQLSDNIGVMTKLENCEENVSLVFHMSDVVQYSTDLNSIHLLIGCSILNVTHLTPPAAASRARRRRSGGRRIPARRATCLRRCPASRRCGGSIR